MTRSKNRLLPKKRTKESRAGSSFVGLVFFSSKSSLHFCFSTDVMSSDDHQVNRRSSVPGRPKIDQKNKKKQSKTKEIANSRKSFFFFFFCEAPSVAVGRPSSFGFFGFFFCISLIFFFAQSLLLWVVCGFFMFASSHKKNERKRNRNGRHFVCRHLYYEAAGLSFFFAFFFAFFFCLFFGKLLVADEPRPARRNTIFFLAFYFVFFFIVCGDFFFFSFSFRGANNKKKAKEKKTRTMDATATTALENSVTQKKNSVKSGDGFFFAGPYVSNSIKTSKINKKSNQL